MADLLMETKSLHMDFGGVAALANIDFTLRRGELRCLIGPNGAGKSTFFKCLTGELVPTRGDIWLGSRNITGWLPHENARLGMSVKTQIPNVLDSLTVAENLWVAAYRNCRTEPSTRRMVDRMLETHGLADLAHQTLATLAHGQRQKVGIACVLATEPRLCLLDEPTAGLDEAEVEWLVKTLLGLVDRMTVVVVEHDMQFIRRIAKWVTVFHQGTILTEGAVATVMNNAKVREVYLGAD